MFDHAEGNLFDNSIKQTSSIDRNHTMMSDRPNLLQHNSGQQSLWGVLPANGNAVLAFFIPDKLLSRIETFHNLISGRLKISVGVWLARSRRGWNVGH
jgi:hypothetical protein